MRPGVLALFLVFLLSLAVGIHVDRSRTILDDAYSQVVVVACNNGYGTGWFVNHDYILTAYHVVRDCSHPVAVRGGWSSNLTLVAYNDTLDIAVLRPDRPPSWARGLPLSFRVSIGDPVFVVGYPIQLYEETRDIAIMSTTPRVASGSVSWLHPDRPVFQFDIPTDAGNSGGPVVSKETGGVVGIVVYARPGVVSEGYFGLRMDAVAEFLDQHGIEYRVAGGGPMRALAELFGG